jgi:hypothetical protein
VNNIVEFRSEDDVEAQYDYLLKKVGWLLTLYAFKL